MFRLLVAVWTLLALAPLSPGQGQGWEPLFDGKSLHGWHVAAKPADRAKGFWKVADYAITCDSRGHKDHDYVWLISDGEYGDFELKVRIRGFRDSTGNSGIQVRSRYDETSGWMDGPQIDVHPPAAWRTGLIYDETRETRRWIFPSLKNWEIDKSHAPSGVAWVFSDQRDGWNDLQIVCRGTDITTKLGGFLVADLKGDGILNDEHHRRRRVGMEGHVAFQLHSGDELYIQYKDIYLKRLD
jgi:hypothetical protein